MHFISMTSQFKTERTIYLKWFTENKFITCRRENLSQANPPCNNSIWTWLNGWLYPRPSDTLPTPHGFTQFMNLLVANHSTESTRYNIITCDIYQFLTSSQRKLPPHTHTHDKVACDIYHLLTRSATQEPTHTAPVTHTWILNRISAIFMEFQEV